MQRASGWPWLLHVPICWGAASIHAVAFASITSASVGGWQEIAPPVVPSQLPTKRLEHSAIYDPVGERMIVFGGLYAGSVLADLWEVGLDPLSGWAPISATGSLPAARWGHSAIYDPVRHRMIVFGGFHEARIADVNILDLASGTWSSLEITGSWPSARFTHAAIYDPVRDRMIVFGGFDTQRRNDVWALSFSEATPTWQQIATSGTAPSPRNGLPAVYDPVRDRLLLFGGNDDSWRNDVWALTLSGTPTWSQIVPSGGSPPGRRQHRLVYDEPRDRLVLFGGVSDEANGFDDVWSLDLAGAPAWTQHAPNGSSPTRRWGHSMVFDPVHERAVVFGGVDLVDWRNDLFALSLDMETPTWTALQPQFEGEPVSAAWGGSAIVDPIRNRMIKFGGLADSPITELMSLDLTVLDGWKTIPAQGSGPSGRFTHSAIYDPVRDRMLVFGGFDVARRNDVWALSLADPPAWSEVATIGSPPSPRNGHTAIYDPARDRMLVFGGNDDLALNDVWELRLSGTPTWAPIYPDREPPPHRRQHAAIYDPIGDRMLVCGGVAQNGTQGFDDLWELTLGARPRWTALDAGEARPSPRWGHSLVYDPTRDIGLMFGGVDLQDWRNDVWILRLREPSWNAAGPSPPLPPKRLHHGAVVDVAGRRMIVHGGLSGESRLADTWALSLEPAPIAVSIDIEPGDPSNRIRESSGDVRCAVFSTTLFDARLIDAATARLASAPARPQVQETDVNGDTRMDVVLRFAARDLVIRPLMLEAQFEALTVDGQAVIGHDAISIIEKGTRPHGGAVFALRAVEPNPASGPIAIHFSLADDAPAEIELIDARGRRVWSEAVGARGPGEHRIDWSGATAPAAGHYWLRLRSGTRVATSKLIVLP